MKNTCIVDNWSLLCAARLLEDGLQAIQARELTEHSSILGEQAMSGSSLDGDLLHHQAGIDTPTAYIGALSNVLTAVVLFDSVAYAENEYEATWQGRTDFVTPLQNHLTPLPAVERQNFSNLIHEGLAFYLRMAQHHGADVYLNPARSTLIERACGLNRGTYGEYVEDVLDVIDEEVRRKLQASPSKILRMSALPNLGMPPILHMVLAGASSRDDVLRVALEMRALHSAVRLRELVSGITVGACRPDTYAVLVDEIQAVIGDLRREAFPKKKYGSIGVSWLLAYEYEIERDVVDHRMFLRHLAACRMELTDAQEHVTRVLS